MSCKDLYQSASEREVFTRHYAKLCELLPATVEELLPHLVTSNVISFEEEEEILSYSTSSSKARAILKPIRKALFEEITRPFHQFLTVMQSSRHPECADLARQICSELNILDTAHHRSPPPDKIIPPYHMSIYRKFLQSKYKLLELISIDDQLDCSSSKYVNLTLVKIDKQGRTTTTENRRGDSVTLSEALDVEGEIKKVILIKGGPGMGKSTLAINICKCWAEGSLLQSYDAVILLTLRTKKIQEAQTVNDLLLTADDELKRKVFSEFVMVLGERVCFLLEGYDELPYELRKSSVFTEVKECFPNCTLVYTSRPEACDKLESVASRIIIIEGFKKESVNEYISNSFTDVKDGKELALKLKSQLLKSQNSELLRILNVPINVAIVCLIFFYYSTLPETLTELYTLLCLRLILRHITTRTANVAQVEELRSLDDLPEDIAKQFSQLCFIAYKGMESNEIIFSSQKLRCIGIFHMSDLGLVVTAPSTSVYGTEKSYNFLHKTLQEFCAAWHISELLLQDQLKCINTYWDDYHYLMVWRFYSGITGLTSKEVLNCILPYKLVKSGLTQKRVQHLMYCMYEAHNSALCQIVGDHLDSSIRYSVTRVIDYFLTQYNGTMKQIHGGHWDDDNFQILIKSLQRRQSRCNDNNLILNISYCRIAHQSFGLLVDLLSTPYPIFELKIRAIKFQSASDVDSSGDYPSSNVTYTYLSDIQLLSQVLTSSNTLSVLDISDTDIGPEGAACFADLRNVLIRDIRMAGCALGPTGADKIGEMLHYNKSIVSIDLSSNDIKDSGMEQLVYHLNNSTKLQHLNLWGNKITEVGADHLSRLIATDHPTLTSIELSWNPLGDEGVHVILSSLTVTMEYIGLRGVYMTSSSCLIIGVSFEKLKSFRFDPPNDCEVISLANTTVLKQLELDITGDSANHKMLSAIRQSDNIETLKLCYSCIEKWVADVTKLLEYSKRLTQLTIINHDQPPQDILLIADSLSINNSVRKFTYADEYMDQTTTLKFLEQLKQAYTVEEVTLGVSRGANYDYQFLGDVEKCVQQINHIRSAKDVLYLKVEITTILLLY